MKLDIILGIFHMIMQFPLCPGTEDSVAAKGIQVRGQTSILEVLEQTEQHAEGSALEKPSMMVVTSRHQAKADRQSLCGFSC